MSDTDKIRASVSRDRPGFSTKIEGPRVGEARLSANDLATTILRTQQALKRVGEVLYGESSGTNAGLELSKRGGTVALG